jgi:hypothetical protein
MNHDDTSAALHHQQQLEEQEQAEKPLFVFCDYIAHRIKEALNGPDPREIIMGAGPVKFDLGAQGEFASTTKTLFVVDKNRTTYKITVEAL